jgi:hypothetical protein
MPLWLNKPGISNPGRAIRFVFGARALLAL